MKSRVLAAIALGASLAAPAAQAFGLVEAWQAAQALDPEFAAARAELEAGRTRMRQARAMRLPEVAASGGASVGNFHTRTDNASFGGMPGQAGLTSGVTFATEATGTVATRWAVTARQPLWDAERFAGARQLEEGARLAEARHAKARQDLALRVAQAYVDVLVAQDSRQTTERQRDAARRALAEATERYEAGDAPVTDKREAQARFDGLQVQVLAAEAERQLAGAAFHDITRLPVAEITPLPAERALALTAEAALEQWIARSETGSPLLEMRRLGRRIASEEIEKYRALTSPRVDLVAQEAHDRVWGGTLGGSGDSSIRSGTRAIGVQFVVPLLTGGMLDARHDEAAALATRAGNELEATRQVVARQARAAWLGVTVGAARVEALGQARKSAAAQLDATAVGVEAGARTTMELLQAQADAFGADSAWTRARYEWLLSRLKLAAVAGELDEPQLRTFDEAIGVAAR